MLKSIPETLLICPLGRKRFEEPVTSKKCGHTFNKPDITEYIKITLISNSKASNTGDVVNVKCPSCSEICVSVFKTDECVDLEKLIKLHFVKNVFVRNLVDTVYGIDLNTSQTCTGGESASIIVQKRKLPEHVAKTKNPYREKRLCYIEEDEDGNCTFSDEKPKPKVKDPEIKEAPRPKAQLGGFAQKIELNVKLLEQDPSQRRQAERKATHSRLDDMEVSIRKSAESSSKGARAVGAVKSHHQ